MVVGQLEARVLAGQAHEDVDRLVADRHPAGLLEAELLVEGDRAVDVADPVAGVEVGGHRAKPNAAPALDRRPPRAITCLSRQSQIGRRGARRRKGDQVEAALLAVRRSELAVAVFAVAARRRACGLRPGAGGGQRRTAAPTAQHRHTSRAAGHEPLNFVAPETVVNGRRTDDRQQDQPETGRPAHLLAGRPELDSRRRRRSGKICFTRSTSAGRSPNGTASRANGPVDDQPGQGRQAGLGHRGHKSKTGDSWFTGEKPGAAFTQQVNADTSRRPDDDPLHVRDPSLDAGRDHRPAGGLARRPSPDPSSPRLGRRAFLGALGGGALASLLPLRAGAAAARSRRRRAAAGAGRRRRSGRRLPIPEVLRGARLGSRSARPRCRSCPGAQTRMWTYGGTFPGPTIRRPAGRRTEVTFEHRLPARGRRADRPPARRPQPQRVRRPARRADRLPSALLLLPDPRGLPPRQSGNDLLIQPGRPQTLRL